MIPPRLIGHFFEGLKQLVFQRHLTMGAVAVGRFQDQCIARRERSRVYVQGRVEAAKVAREHDRLVAVLNF